MKLRFQANSLRLRLKQGEVAQLEKTGRVEENIVFGTGEENILTYVLESVPTEMAPHAKLRGSFITVQVSAHAVTRWAQSEQVSIEEHQPVSDEHCLQIMIEKDFACLDGTDSQNADTFPHPLRVQSADESSRA